MQYRKIALVTVACAALTGCAHPDAVIFVTNTSLGINVESKPPTVNLAYDRTEGYFGPVYDDGALPPVVASIQTDGKVFNPSVRQVYATGQAAALAVGAQNASASDPALTGRKSSTFFGTTTTVGFKAGFDATTNAPDSLIFGYRRTEFSYIPLGTDKKTGNDTYASALASVDSNTNTVGTSGVTGVGGAGLTHSQFIATGVAADALATSQKIRDAFGALSQNAFAPSVLVFQSALKKIGAHLPDDATAFKADLPAFVEKAYTTDPMKSHLEAFADKQSFLDYLSHNPSTAENLADKNGL